MTRLESRPPASAVASPWRLLAALAALLIAAFVQPALAAPAESPRPRLVVIGATAKSSTEIIRQALAAGYEVIGVARRPEDVKIQDAHFRLLKGDVYDPASLEAAIGPGDVVVSMIGPRLNPMDQTEVPASFDLFTTGTGNILAAMKKQGSRRLVVASSLGVEDPFPTEKPAPGDMRLNWLWKTRYLYRNMGDMEKLVRASGVDYVIVRPPFLVEEPARNDYHVSVNQDSPKGSMMTYADLGAFVLAQARTDQYRNDTVGLYTDRPLKFGQNVDFGKLAKEAAEKARQAAPAPAAAP